MIVMVQIFLSHTKRDENSCDRFDRAAVREGIQVFRSEFENIEAPSWATIKTQIGKSNALFLMVGPELVKAQKESDKDEASREQWKYTQNWIAYEIGLACQKGIDVWVICDNVEINFPVPYLNNYEVYGMINQENVNFYRDIFKEYNLGRKLPFGTHQGQRSLRCPYERCKSVFNFWSIMKIGEKFICPKLNSTNPPYSVAVRYCGEPKDSMSPSQKCLSSTCSKDK